jgi:hypothetical protein
VVWSRGGREGPAAALPHPAALAIVPVIATRTRGRRLVRRVTSSPGPDLRRRPALPIRCLPPRTVAVAASVPWLAVGGLPPVDCGGVCGHRPWSKQASAAAGRQHAAAFALGPASRSADPQAALAEEKNSNALLLSALLLSLCRRRCSPLPPSSFCSAPAICRRSRSRPQSLSAGTLDLTFSLRPCLDDIKIPSFFTLSPSHQFLAACMEY